MSNIEFRHRFKVVACLGAIALAPAAVAGCDSIQEQLLEPQQPQVISPADVGSGPGALALYVGALGRLSTSLNGGNNNNETIWNFEALTTDEMRVTDTFSQRIDADQRQTQTLDANVVFAYNRLQLSRGYARDAINGLQSFAAGETAKIGEMYFVIGIMELNLGQAFCNGVPLGETVGGIPVYTDPLTNAQVFQQAIVRFDSAIIVASGTDAASTRVRTAARIAKAKAQVNLDQHAAAAATVAGIPTSNAYLITYSIPTQSNEWWQMGTTTKRYSVADTVDGSGFRNNLPFASANDPRVKSRSVSNPRAFDGTAPWFELLNWGREDPIALTSGLDARLIEAEAQLRLNTVAGRLAMNTALNGLRTAPPQYGNLVIAAMPVLPPPATQAEAVTQFFREKAFWQYGRGERLSDMRRLIRQYQLTEDQVFPTGAFHKGGVYGKQVNFPVPDAERSNPKFAGCLDRNA